MKSTAIVILNYHGWEDTIECLESLQKVEHNDFIVIVVDNGSANDSVDKIRAWADGRLGVESEFIDYSNKNKPVFVVEYTREEAEGGGLEDREKDLENYLPAQRLVLIRSDVNLGFSGGNNVGARYAVKRGYAYIALLNNDTVIVDRDFLNKTIKVFEDNESCCAVGPKIVNLAGHFDGPYIYVTFWGELFLLTLKNQLRKLLGCTPVYIDLKAISSARPVPVYKISGACMTFDARFLNEIGYLDENVWLSCEESIVAEKVLTKGGKIYFQPLTLIIHKGARSPKSDSSRLGNLKNHYVQREYFLRTYKAYGKYRMALITLVHKIRLFFEWVRG